jgi:hypothetical protein
MNQFLAFHFLQSVGAAALLQEAMAETEKIHAAHTPPSLPSPTWGLKQTEPRCLLPGFRAEHTRTVDICYECPALERLVIHHLTYLFIH